MTSTDLHKHQGTDCVSEVLGHPNSQEGAAQHHQTLLPLFPADRLASWFESPKKSNLPTAAPLPSPTPRELTNCHVEVHASEMYISAHQAQLLWRPGLRLGGGCHPGNYK
eukprot:364743-Chlamydomonas_euryale.AAC.31